MDTALSNKKKGGKNIIGVRACQTYTGTSRTCRVKVLVINGHEVYSRKQRKRPLVSEFCFGLGPQPCPKIFLCQTHIGEDAFPTFATQSIVAN